ncbi:hypothetical protein B5F09_07065 [Erysipelatoclostridium sp. An173]|uniref:hypothetical protein n=1 Tax=Erysipelatoclostridium sp. An173 TaxID=1965571 RepID=UPI000B39E692|nr:hypothetical protein [Erysipelatoclostridium sp. An173]OUP77119.1 hypothetical protein B5F09_07065 [Erysipelatoclostridium sp. An173]
MAAQKQPIDLVITKGNKHITKKEIQARRDSEVKPIVENIIPPSYLSKKQKEEFEIYVEQLLNLMYQRIQFF